MLLKSVIVRLTPPRYQRVPVFGALRRNATLGEVERHAGDVFTASTELREKWIPYHLTTLIDGISEDDLKALKKCRGDDTPRLLADALRPQFTMLAELARLGDDIHLTMPEDENLTSNFEGSHLHKNMSNLLMQKGLSALNARYLQAALFRLKEEFSDVFKQLPHIGSGFTKKKIMTELPRSDVAWEVLKDMASAPAGSSFPDINSFLHEYFSEKVDRDQSLLIKDFYKRLIEKKAIIPSDSGAWENNKSDSWKKSWKDVPFQATGISENLTVSPIVQVLKMPDGTSRIRSISLTEALLPQLLEVARACQRIQRETGKEWPTRMGELSREMGLYEKTLERAIRKAPEAIKKLFVAKKHVGTLINLQPDLTDEMIEHLLAPNGAAKREAWGEADPKIIVEYVIRAGIKREKDSLGGIQT